MEGLLLLAFWLFSRQMIFFESKEKRILPQHTLKASFYVIGLQKTPVKF